MCADTHLQLAEDWPDYLVSFALLCREGKNHLQGNNSKYFYVALGKQVQAGMYLSKR